MRLIEKTRDGFFYKAYSKLIRFRHYNSTVPNVLRRLITGTLLKIIDLYLDLGPVKKLTGDKGTLFVFNADQMHKAHPIKGTSRSIVHCNFVKDYSTLSGLITDHGFDPSALTITSQKLCDCKN